ncbi:MULTISPECIES: 16S rRNA (cytosine(967)-C(5))-methyltransferase RsmB [unclassified Achromobacter]|uniref:16S rRNA (cytosine(967)-C(5))-methyltransferase RsmB n=1 Tax=unclassified Achromobacter TaxID=2626865 RepID=UPI000B51B63F|nr:MULTISPECIES: 16S rRNA (cytosine(967)-C(5))-methyltransferase RsmB [unclassified Achromobacter]OWT75801.1 16S rRNA (cytosine(967)-C(5))-methyltransferase [Achromobacter sp. HZ28]OWT76461.1 16S rRNA (cytosine(967)-C(5))-methyltransferase [Achromobacter sp. HZ34]
MSSSPPASSRPSAPLHDLLLESAEVVRAVQAGRSMTDAIAQVPAEFRAGTQALSFHTMRHLGTARALRRLLVPRDPPEPLVDALLQVSLTLLLPAASAAGAAAAADSATPATTAATAATTSAPAVGTRLPDSSAPIYTSHTVVDQAVKAADSMRRLLPFKGLVNGCLRGFLRDPAGLLAQAAKTVEGRWNHPQWWVDKIRSAYPADWQQLLAAANVPAPLTLRVNRRRATREQVLAAFAAAGIAAEPSGSDGLALAQPRPVAQLPGYDQGWWSVQDAGAQLAVPLLAVRDGERVLDACAAPGGKTAHLLELADVSLTALDADGVRLQRVRENLERLDVRRPDTVLRRADAADLAEWWDGVPFDAVLADVPCTASGIVRRHPDIRWLRRADDVPRTVKLQTRIVDALWTTVAPGGRLLYVTCSIFPEENERQAAAFLTRHPDARRLDAPGQLLPVAMDTTPGAQRDGFFYALFAKAS